MGYKKKVYSSEKNKDEKPKRSFSDRKSYGDKPAYKKRSDRSFSNNKDSKRSFGGPSDRDSRPGDRERKPFRKPEGKFGDENRRGGSKPTHSPRNPKWEARPDWKGKKDDVKLPRGFHARGNRKDEDGEERKPFRKPENKFGDKRRGDDARPSYKDFKREDRPERTSEEDTRAPRESYSRDSRSDDRERKPFRKSKFADDSRPSERKHKWGDKPETPGEDDARAPRESYSRDSRSDDRERKPFRKSKFGDDSRPSERRHKWGDKPETPREDDARPPRARESRDSRSDDRERKPFRRPESNFGGDRRKDSFESRDRKPGGDRRYSRPSFDRDSRSGDGEKKWNRKADNEFYGDRRKSGPPSRGSFKKSFKQPQGEGDGSIRLNKFISNAGICSRREADEMIEAGVVSVNGEVMTQLGYRVKPEDVVKYNNEVLKSERMVYILLNKPKDFITTSDDPEKRKTVMTLIANACKERVYSVGRLDRNTTGLLLMTNDGDLTRKLTHPSFEVQKIYQVELDKALQPSDMEEIEKGLRLDDGIIKVDAISYVGTAQDKSIVGVELHSGKNRIVRRIFESLGYEVRKLDRVYFGGISKKDLPRGRWRFLTDLEVASLKIMTGSKKFKNLEPVEENKELE